MAKILLVEDDKSLREIYGVRLMAEGYTIVSAGDGEEALAIAIKERPDLIVSDVMMPKISGFDMLDILRSTSETKNVKVIMMTALSSDDQRARGEALGADRYLVKSQVGIEDVVRTVHDVLGDSITPAAVAQPTFGPAPTPVGAPAPAAPQPVAPAPVIAEPVAEPVPAPVPTPAPAPVAPVIDLTFTPAPTTPVPAATPVVAPAAAPTPVSPPPIFEPRPVTAVQPRPVETTVAPQPLPAPVAAPAPIPAPVIAEPVPAPVPTPAPAPVAPVIDSTPAPTPV